MNIRRFIVGLVLAGLTWTSGLQAQSQRILTSTESSPAAGSEYEFIIRLLTTLGTNLSTRDAATEVNESPNLLATSGADNTKNWAVSANVQYSDSSTGLSSRLVRNDERLGFLNWIIKDSFNKDKWDLFDNKEYVEAGVPELGFLKGFTGALSQAVLQTGGDSSRVNVGTITTEEKSDREFQF